MRTTAMKFKIGDRVRTRFHAFDGQEGVIRQIWKGTAFPYEVDFPSSRGFPSCDKELTLVNAIEEPDECAAFFS